MFNNFVVEDNIAFAKGPFLIGGGRASHNIIVRRNHLHGIGMILGYGAQNEDIELRDNIVAAGKIQISKWNKLVDEGNIRELPAAKAIVIASKYDNTRAHVVIYNGAGAAKVPLDTGSFLQPGDRFKLFHGLDCFGQGIASGVWDGRIDVPMAGPFGAFVLAREPAK